MQLASSNAVQNSTVAVNVNGGLAFSPGIGTFTLGGLSGSMSFSATDTSGTAVTLQVGGNNTDAVFSGSMTAGGPLVKIGTGNLVLSDVEQTLSRHHG